MSRRVKEISARYNEVACSRVHDIARVAFNYVAIDASSSRRNSSVKTSEGAKAR